MKLTNTSVALRGKVAKVPSRTGRHGKYSTWPAVGVFVCIGASIEPAKTDDAARMTNSAPLTVARGSRWQEPIVRNDQSEYLNECGEPRDVDAFMIEHRGQRYVLPAYVEIVKGGVTLFRDERPSGWKPPYKGASYSSLGAYLLIVAFDQDCIDILVRRLFVILPDGSVVHQPVWSSHWRDGFFLGDGELTYWSEAFCREEDTERPAGISYVYVFSEVKRLFERKDVPDSLYCNNDEPIPFLVFQPAQEIKSP